MGGRICFADPVFYAPRAGRVEKAGVEPCDGDGAGGGYGNEYQNGQAFCA